MTAVELPCAMMTRSAVAKALGRSVATVRKLEGVKLFPERNDAGTWLFDPEEVKALAREVHQTGRALPSGNRPFVDAAVNQLGPDDMLKMRESADDVLCRMVDHASRVDLDRSIAELEPNERLYLLCLALEELCRTSKNGSMRFAVMLSAIREAAL